MTNFDFNIEDDLNVGDSYPEMDLTPKPPLPGNYVFKAAKWDFRRTPAGELVLWKNPGGDPTYPLIQLTTVEITDPFEYGRKATLFQDISTVPFQREEGRRASQAADLLRALKADATATNTGEVIRELTESLNGGMEFRARLDYTGYDKAFADAQIAAAGGKTALSKQQLNEIYNKAKIRGYKNILKANRDAGKEKLPLHKWVGPSGNVVECRPALTIFYPASEAETVHLGPDKAVL